MEERLFNLSFVGCLNRNRVLLASLVSGKPRRKIIDGLIKRKEKTLKSINEFVKWEHNNDYFYFAEDFNRGLKKDRYAFILKNSKIALCPRGWVNTETFRLYEAMKAGCVVIAEKLPVRDYYKNIPVIQIEDWRNGLRIARKLIKDEKRLIELGNENRDFYNSHFHPKIVAAKIIKSI